ncbi:MAG: ROK family protein, partial [Halanaerobiales bacterium]
LELIKKDRLGESSGGRPPVLLKLNPEAGYLIGVNLGPGLLEVVLSNLEGKILNKKQKRVEPIGKKEVVEKLFSMIDYIFELNKNYRQKLMGIGLALHGMVDVEEGKSIFAPYYDWHNLEIKEIFQEKYQVPIFVDNDVRAMALGERWFGSCREVDNFVTINIGNGIGGGIMIDGELYRGRDYSAGEIGHIVIDNDGPRCSCGNYGCLESLASDMASIKRMKELIKTQSADISIENLDMDKICDLAEKGNQLARQVVDEKIKYLGTGIAYLLNILNPSMIVLVGKITRAGELLFNNLREIIEEKALNTPAENLKIKKTDLEDNAATIGAITLVLKQFFQKGGNI